MHRSLRFAAGAGIGALVTLALGTPFAGARTTTAISTTGAVYAQSNAPHGNRVLVYSRGANGTLHAAGSYSTAGSVAMRRVPSSTRSRRRARSTTTPRTIYCS